MFKRITSLCIVLVFLATLVGCDQARNKLEQVKFGMTRAEVVQILGEPQEKETKTFGSWTGEVLRWRLGAKTLVIQLHHEKVEGKQLTSAVTKARQG